MRIYANDSLEKNIPEKNVKETISMKTPRPENLDPVQTMDDYLQEFLRQTIRPQDIAIDNTFE